MLVLLYILIEFKINLNRSNRMPFTVKQDSVIMGVTEFRNNIPSLLKENHEEEIIIVNRDKPLGVLINFNKYQSMQDLLEIAEDYILSEMVKESKKIKGKMLSQEEMEARYGI